MVEEHVLATITRLVPGVSVLSSWYETHILMDTSRNARIYPFWQSCSSSAVCSSLAMAFTFLDLVLLVDDSAVFGMVQMVYVSYNLS
jgi:hypothetical protein